MDDNPHRPNFSSGIQGLLQQFATRNADTVIEGSDVDNESRVHNQRQLSLPSGLPQRQRAAGKVTHRLLPRLRIAQADLSDVGSTCCRLRYGVSGVNMTANDPLRHVDTVP